MVPVCAGILHVVWDLSAEEAVVDRFGLRLAFGWVSPVYLSWSASAGPLAGVLGLWSYVRPPGSFFPPFLVVPSA